MLRLTVSFLLLLLAAPGGGAGARAVAQPADVWREAPEYLPLVAPSGERRAAYRTYVSSLDLDAVLARLGAGWEARPQSPSDAFGQTGRYDRFKLVRLYGANRPRVARGPRPSGHAPAEAWTLISPHPDPALARLRPGTLLIVLSLGPS